MVEPVGQDHYSGRARLPSISRAQLDDLRQRLWEFSEHLDRGDHNTTELYAVPTASTVQSVQVPFFNATLGCNNGPYVTQQETRSRYFPVRRCPDECQGTPAECRWSWKKKGEKVG